MWLEYLNPMRMRKITWILVFMFAVFTVSAQNISVKSFKPLPNDMTASSLEGKRIDQNGQVAALIKIVTTQTGFTFEGGTLGIVDTKQEAGEVWVWVPRAARKITIKHPQLGVLRDYAYPVEIEAERTYEMVLTTAKVETIVKEEVNMQYLAFQITPANAILEVDDQLWTVDADGSAMKYVDFGTYSYRVQAPNYHTEAGRIIVDDPNNTQIVNITLQPNFGWIEVLGTGNLQGASVYVDNAMIGRAPCKSEALKSGPHTVRIAKEMYGTYSETVTVNDNQTTRVAPTLAANFAEVTLKVDADAEIWVNNEKKGKRIWTGPLSAGTYKIECRQANHEATVVTQEITTAMGGQTITLQAPLPIYGSLNVESTPNFCMVYIDGKDMGTTPKAIPEILVGSHELRLSKEGYKDHTETITLAKGERKQVKADLQSDGTTPPPVRPQQPEQPKPKKPTEEKPTSSIFFVMANAAYSIAPQTSFGLTVGSAKELGWYVSANSNFSFQNADYECDGDGNISGLTSEYSYFGTQKTSRLSATAGIVVQITDPVYAYVGGGYGFRNLLWVFDTVKWAKNTDYSYQGLALDAGVMLHFGSFGISAGVQTVGFSYMEAKIGIGYTLKKRKR